MAAGGAPRPPRPPSCERVRTPPPGPTDRAGATLAAIASPDAPERPTLGLAGRVVLFALAAFGALMLVDWVLGWIFGLAKFLLLVLVVLGVAAFVVSWRSSDD